MAIRILLAVQCRWRRRGDRPCVYVRQPHSPSRRLILLLHICTYREAQLQNPGCYTRARGSTLNFSVSATRRGSITTTVLVGAEGQILQRVPGIVDEVPQVLRVPTCSRVSLPFDVAFRLQVSGVLGPPFRMCAPLSAARSGDPTGMKWRSVCRGIRLAVRKWQLVRTAHRSCGRGSFLVDETCPFDAEYMLIFRLFLH